MKILINYDFINAIKNINEPISSYKVVRNESKKWLKINLPLYYLLGLAFFRKFSYATIAVVSEFGLLTANKVAASKLFKEDKYYDKSKKDLIKLTSSFDTFNIKTSYDLLLKSEQYDKELMIHYNEKKLPLLKENKYILVPYYSYNGQIEDICMIQEHIIGSNDYELSLGAPSKKLKLVKSLV